MEEVNEIEKEQDNRVKNKKVINKLIILLLIVIGIMVFYLAVSNNKKGDIKTKVKTSLDKLVEKADLETVDITYNVIAKQCKNSDNCDKSSNKINDFEYVISCKGTITAGIDFKKIKIDVDKKNKKIIVEMPEAMITNDPTIKSMNFMNGSDIPASELPNARKLCQYTTREKSEADGKLLIAAKDQAKTVLESFYSQWVKAYDSEYKVEIK